MRSCTLFLTAGGILLATACTTRTVILTPAPPPRREGPRPSTAATLGVPPGHLPRAGECRIWIPGTPPGQQPGPRSRSCTGVAAFAPAGSWIIYRPTRDKKLVHVRVVDERRPGIVIRIRIFDLDSQQLVREEEPGREEREHEDEEGRRRNDRPREERPREQPPGPRTAATLDVPPDHLPEVGECRVWIPGTPPGQQPRPKSRSCDGIASVAPAGSRIIYRPARDKKVVHVRVVDERRAGIVIRVLIFDIDTRQLVREEHQ